MIWKIPADGAPTVLAGSSGTHGSADGIGKNATFYAPQGVAVDGAGNVYVSDTGNSTIRVITSNGVVSTLAGTAGKVGSINGLGPAARFSDPIGVAVDAAGNVYVADASNNSIRKITPAGLVSILAGKPGSYGNTDGPVAKALFEGPEWLAVDAAGNVYVAETGNEGDGTIRKIGTNGIVSTVAGGSGKSGSADGVGKSALFSNLGGVAVDRAGNVLVADAGNGTIRLITTNGVATTQAGVAGEPGDSDGVGNEARFGRPGGVAVDTEGNFYVADLSSVRKGISLGSVVAPSITVQPQSQTGSAGENVTFSVGVAGTTPLFYQWYGGKAKLAGATQSSYTLTNVLARNNGIYSVVVTNFAGKATSAFATFLYVAKVQPQTQTLTNAIFANGVFSVSIPSQAGINYVLEYKASLTDPVWQTVGTTAGTGGVIVLSDSGAAGSTRFYRVLIQ
jgi:sugar lactone lactonase YvrE